MKKLSLIIFVLLCSKLVSFAQSAEEGMYDWYADQTTKSKSILEKLVSSNNIWVLFSKVKEKLMKL